MSVGIVIWYRAAVGQEDTFANLALDDCSSAIADVGDQRHERLQRGGQRT